LENEITGITTFDRQLSSKRDVDKQKEKAYKQKLENLAWGTLQV
jgi:hypothetical protein